VVKNNTAGSFYDGLTFCASHLLNFFFVQTKRTFSSSHFLNFRKGGFSTSQLLIFGPSFLFEVRIFSTSFCTKRIIDDPYRLRLILAWQAGSR
jgi:hypothetical protein